MAVKQSTNPNPALMESLLAQARNKNLVALNEVNRAQIGARKMNQVELDKVNQARNRNQNELNLINLNRQNKLRNKTTQARPKAESDYDTADSDELPAPKPQQTQTDPELIENTLNRQRETARGGDEEANNPEDNQNLDEVDSNNPEDPVEADRQANEQSRDDRMNQLKTGRKKEGDTVTSENETPSAPEPQAQENDLAKEKQSQIGQMNNLPGMKNLTGGIDPNDSPEEIAKKGIKMAAKKVAISVLLWASPYILAGLLIGGILAILLFVSMNVYQCYQKKGVTGLVWSSFWKGYRQTAIDAASGKCIADDPPKAETTKKEAPPPPATPPPPEEKTP